jgi:hypothetical protein
MSRRSDEYQVGVPQKPYDLLFEGLIVLGVVLVIVVILAAVIGSPDYPTVRGQDVATLQPIAFDKTAATILSGQSSLQTYGPPYTNDTDNAQKILGISPATWAGVRIPIDAAKALVLDPLAKLAQLSPTVATALDQYNNASSDQQAAWNTAYLAALDSATASNGVVQVPDGDYGPVPTLVDGLRSLAAAGLLEGALQADSRIPYALDNTRALLFFQDDVDHNVADSLDMLGSQWGIVHETGDYPGAWWLAPYAFFYQIPPMSSSPNGDLQVAVIMIVIFLILIFLPVIPGLNLIPRGVRLYRLLWRDWYRRQDAAGGTTSTGAE